ncbi:hypothetical protein Acsp02_78440 [Actinoplanes sp. NBRC 103695]|nr:hypothetical protein Acsp02_78440 [Actinoplanes sp. NBRC 103695]
MCIQDLAQWGRFEFRSPHGKPGLRAMHRGMGRREFEQRLEIYRQALRAGAKERVVEQAWHDLYAAACSLQGPPPTGPSKEVAAAYALRDARNAKNGPQTFYTMDETADAFGEALEAFSEVIRLP